MTFRVFLIIGVIAVILNLQGCFTAVVAGAGTVAIAAHDRRTAGAFVDDVSIELKARSLIVDDSTLRGRVHISITSVNGIVLVSGEAETRRLRNRVIAHVKAVKGIRRIHDAIRIAPPSRLSSRSRDTWITGKVKGKMLTVKNFDASRIKVVTENGVVYLMGLVKRQEADRATDIARHITRVRKVVRLFEYID